MTSRSKGGPDMAENKGWWVGYLWRMVQTNLREIDMEDIDAVKFARSLKDYHATVVTLNAAGIIASYDTKLAFQEKSHFLHGDSLKKIIEECHKAGIRVIARCDFSKISERLFEKHPDWAYRTADGNAVNYNGFVQTCVNSEYQQKYIFEILGELFKEHDFDGIFCNMSGFMVVDYDYHYYGPCHCENCQKLFKEQFGGEIPDKDDMRNPMYGRYIAFRSQSVKKQKMKLYNFIKGINENIAVNGFDYQRIESNQDIDRPAWVYQTSTNARKTSGIDKRTVTDSASVDFMGFQYRNSSVSPALLEMRQWQNLANSKSTSLYIMGTLDNHKDRTGIRASQKAFDFFAKNEELYKGMQSDADVLLIDKPLLAREDKEVCGWIRVLTENHIPFDEMKLAAVRPEILAEKKIVILADTRFISDEQAQMFDAYVANGGTLIATGESGCNGANYRPRQENALKSLGAGKILEKRSGLKSSIFEIREKDEEAIPLCAKKGLGYVVPGSSLIVSEITDPEKSETLLALIPEQLYGPPEVCYPKKKSEVPGLIKTSFGIGCGIYIPWMAGTFYYEQGYYNTFAFLRDVLIHLCGAKDLAPETTPMCEITVMKREGAKLIQLVNTSGCFSNSFFEPLPIGGIALDVDASGKKVTAYNGGTVTVEKNKIVLDCLKAYEAVLIED